MNLGDRLRAAFRAFNGEKAQLQLRTIQNGIGPRKDTRELLLLYRQHWWFHAVVQFIASRIARTEWSLYRPKGGAGMPPRMRFDSGAELRRALKLGDLTLVEEHPVLEILQRPCPVLKGMASHKLSQIHLEVAGERFWLRNRDGAGRTVELWPVAPHWVVKVPVIGSEKFLVTRGSFSSNFDPEDILWTKELDAEDPYGRGASMGLALEDEVSADDYAGDMVNARLAEGGVPSLIVSLLPPTPGAAVPRERVDETAQEWKRDHAPVRAGGKGKPIRFVNSEVKVQNVAQNFVELGLSELRAFSRDAVQLGFSVAPEELGIVENSNRATIDSAEYLTALNVMVPRLEFLRDDWQTELVDEWDDRLVIGYPNPIPDDLSFKAAVMQAHPHGFRVDEVRDLAGAPELDADAGQVFAVKAGTQFVSDYAKVVVQKPAPDGQDQKDKAKREMPADPPWARTGTR